jgi:multicomponent Na+:H+ antiporter subunit G
VTLLLDLFTVVTVSAGVLFFVAGTVGLLRFPDALSRLHTLTKADALGFGLVAVGLLPRVDAPWTAAKLVLAWALVLFAGAAAGQLIARVTRRDGERP